MATIELPWEDDVLPGPVNEYLEVIDIDPVSGQFYEPVDLNNRIFWRRTGCRHQGDPRFHQQMVFAVAMRTIRAFERALGRKVFWSPRWSEAKGTYEEVPKLRIYPHALREPNAYYSRDKKALLFGYFLGLIARGGSELGVHRLVARYCRPRDPTPSWTACIGAMPSRRAPTAWPSMRPSLISSPCCLTSR